MISSNELLNIVNKYSNGRLNDYIVLPFCEFPIIDNSQREYEWYSLQLKSNLTFIEHVFVNYPSQAICIKRNENRMLLKWTVEIPYGERSKYIDFVDEINRAVSQEGSVNLFVCNNPYSLCSYLNFEDIPENGDKINSILKKYKRENMTEKGLEELIKEIGLGRKFDLKQIPPFADRIFIHYMFSIAFTFSELDVLKEKGYDHTIDLQRKKIFISYCHADKSLVYKITDKLENYGINLWIDKKSIDYGENIARSISSGIKESDLAILFLSCSMKSSNFSQFELENIMTSMIKKAMGWFMIKLDNVNVDDIMPSIGNYLYYDFYENQDIDKLVQTIIDRIKAL